MKTRSFKLKAGVGLALLAGVCLGIPLAEETNPYLSITERNPFGLKPPPPPRRRSPPQPRQLPPRPPSS